MDTIVNGLPKRLKPYPAYKPSCVEWLGEIPAHWEVKQLKRLCTFQYGDSLAADSRAEGNVRVYGSNGPVGNHNISNTRGPCLVIGRKGSFGKVNFSSPSVFAIDTTFFVDSRHTDAQLRWLYYLLTVIRLDAATKDSAIPGLHREDAYVHMVPVCALSEQRAIAAFLDRETAKIDALAAKKEQLIELLQEKRTALISQAVTKGLDPNVPMKDSGVQWLGEVPAHWEMKRLWHLTPSNRRIMYGIVLPGPHVEDGIPIVKGGDVSPERLRLDALSRTEKAIESRYARSRLQKGDLVYAIRGSFGDVAMVPAELEGSNLTQDAARVAYSECANGLWLLYLLRSRATFAQLEAGALGATIRGINIRDLRRTVIPVPPRIEQQAIAVYVNRKAEKTNRLIAKVRDATEHLKELRVALISAAVTGRIDVRQEVP